MDNVACTQEERGNEGTGDLKQPNRCEETDLLHGTILLANSAVDKDMAIESPPLKKEFRGISRS